MSKIDDAEALQGFTRTSQIIVAALATGVIFFWVIVIFLLGGGGPAAKPAVLGLPLMTAVALLFSVASIAASILIPRLAVDGAIRQIAKGVTPDETAGEGGGARQIYPSSDVVKLMPVYTTQLIIASALNEGAALFTAIAYMLEAHPAMIATAGVLVALILSRFPTEDRVRGWLDVQLERLAASRRDDF